jgi:hypothetical protein
MISFIVGLVIGAIGASIGWFFIWRNNKEKFAAALKMAGDIK